MRDVAMMQQKADRVGKELATLTLQTEVRFAPPDDLRCINGRPGEENNHDLCVLIP